MSDDFAEQLSAARPRLLNIAFGLSDRRSDAEDLVQDTIERALRHRGRFDGRNLPGWLLTIMHNRATDLRRRAGRRAELPLKEELIWRGNLEAQAIAHLELERILQQERDPVLAISLLMSTKEIALLLDRAQGTIKGRLVRARARARQAVA